MVKRKRYEPKLDAQLQDLEVKLFRALKTSKGFERQRLAKRVREANADKVERLEREVAVLKSLDLHQAAHAILCTQLLKIKGVAESPNLPDTIKPVPKPNITEEERSALHNVTSGLCNRKQVKDVLDEAVKATCLALRVDLPGKGAKGPNGKAGRKEQEEQADDRDEKPARKAKAAVESTNSKSRKKPAESDEESEEEWGGISGDEGHHSGDEDEEEKALSRYEALLGVVLLPLKRGSQAEVRGPSDYFSGGESDADDDDAALDLDEDEEDEEEDEAEEEEEESDASSEAVSPPPKKARATKAAPSKPGDSTFLPSLMGGYISGSESDASDVDVAPARNNRRGQRARQAIWEKKFKQEAKHLNKPKDSRDDGWDAKRGAVGNEHGAPWKQGIKSAFEKRTKPTEPAPEGVHPDRQRNFNDSAPAPAVAPPKPARRNFDDAAAPPKLNRRALRDAALGRAPRSFDGPKPRFEPAVEAAPKIPAKPKRDDTGPLHASWDMAKAAKEKMANAKFEGKKITFD
ncbi:Protein bud22 [Apiospora rasikravindrae]|uniref:Protein bud22 n=1 Tax=Apiospora rasikravindrae TaxID=990691 RepID=A0ABR1TF03_9PEZI